MRHDTAPDGSDDRQVQACVEPRLKPSVPAFRSPRSLRSRILLLAVACFLPSAILFALAVLDATRVDAGRAEAEALRLARLISGQQRHLLDGIEGALRQVALSRQVEGEDAQACADRLRRALTGIPALKSIAKLRPDGSVACSTLPTPASLNVADQAYFRQALESRSFTVSGYRIGKIFRQPQLTMALPILDERDEVRFLFAAGVSLDWLSRQLEDLGLPPGATVDIVDRNGVVVARYPDPQVRVGRALPSSVRVRALAPRSAATSQIIGEDGTSHLYGAASFGPQSMGAQLIVGIPAGVAFATSNRLAITTAGSALVTVLLVLVGGWFGARAFLLRWVDVLTATVRRFADGDHAVRARVPAAAGELGELSAAFDAMADRLAAQEQELQERNAALRESEARYRLLAENATDIIMLERPDGTLDYVSPACLTVLGYGPEEMAVLAPAELVHPDDLERVTATRAGLGPGRPEMVSTHRLRRKDGRYIWVEAMFRVVDEGRSGAGPNILVTLRDIDRRRAAEDALRESEARREGEERYRALVETSPDAVFVHRDGIIVLANQRAATLFGAATPEALLGRSVFEALIDETSLPLARARTATLTSPGARAGLAELTFRRLDGTPFPVEVAAAAVTIEGRLVVQVTLRDITQRKAAEAALTAAKDKAEAADRAKSEFLATMSHEIRTPLTAVIGMADLLTAKQLDLEALRYVGAIRGAGRQLLAIVNDILDFQRLGAGRLPLHKRDFALAKLLEEVGSTLRPIAHDKGLALDITASPDPPPLRGDPVRLQQVLFNLVGNALKFTTHGAVQLTATLADRADGRIQFRVEVQDTGAGIPSEQLSRLFQPFSQADSSATRRFGGAGLGLAISRQLVELMGGRIGCDSRPGQGSTFWFEVPLERGQARAIAPAAAELAPVPPLAILLAEDAPLNRQLLTDMLGRHGHRVTTAENGAEFLERARERRFDVLLVDIQMPVLDGEEAVRSLRGREGPNRQTPAVALTANVMTEDRRRYLAAGFDAVLHKPVVWGDLFAELARLVQGPGPALADRAPESQEEDDDDVPVAEGPPIDWSFIQAALGGLSRDAADSFLTRALADAREGLRGLGDPTLDAHARARLAHRLKGTARSFGLRAIGEAAEAVERAVKDGDGDLAHALDRYAAALEGTAEQLTAGRPRSS